MFRVRLSDTFSNTLLFTLMEDTAYLSYNSLFCYKVICFQNYKLNLIMIKPKVGLFRYMTFTNENTQT